MSKYSGILSKKYIPGKNINNEQDNDDNQINSIEETVNNIEQSLNNWTIPKTNINTIYKI